MSLHPAQATSPSCLRHAKRSNPRCLAIWNGELSQLASLVQDPSWSRNHHRSPTSRAKSGRYNKFGFGSLMRCTPILDWFLKRDREFFDLHRDAALGAQLGHEIDRATRTCAPCRKCHERELVSGPLERKQHLRAEAVPDGTGWFFEALPICGESVVPDRKSTRLNSSHVSESRMPA